MINDKLSTRESAHSALGVGGGVADDARVVGSYHAVFRDPQGNVTWEGDVPNLVTDAGAKLMQDTVVAGSAYTAAAYLLLKGTGSAAVGDTQASHAGWLEVGGTNAPVFSGSRKTLAWSSATGTGAGNRTKATSGTYTFTFTSGGVVDGMAINLNGSSTVDNTTGVLFSAGTFDSPGAQTVTTGSTLTVSYNFKI